VLTVILFKATGASLLVKFLDSTAFIAITCYTDTEEYYKTAL
jgi:hypothetical protein